MRTIRIYQAGLYQAGQQIELSPEAAQHVAVVLRMQVDEKIILFNGDNKEYNATIIAIKKKQVQVGIETIKEVNKESAVKIHLAQALVKGERMEFVMQKAVELGVTSITPIITEHSVVKLDKERMTKKLQQWQAIAIAACEQSGRNIIPRVGMPLLFACYVEQTQADLKYIMHPRSTTKWRDSVVKPAEIVCLIGPEGGFSKVEIKLACQFDFLPLSLGPRILRTETAALATLSILQAVYGDL